MARIAVMKTKSPEVFLIIRPEVVAPLGTVALISVAVAAGFRPSTPSLWPVIITGLASYLMGVRGGYRVARGIVARESQVVRALSYVILVISYALFVYYLLYAPLSSPLMFVVGIVSFALIVSVHQIQEKHRNVLEKAAVAFSLIVFAIMLYLVPPTKPKAEFLYYVSPLRAIFVSTFIFAGAMVLLSEKGRKLWMEPAALALYATVAFALVRSGIDIIATLAALSIYMILNRKMALKQVLILMGIATLIALSPPVSSWLLVRAQLNLNHLDLIIACTPPTGIMSGKCVLNPVDSGVIIHQYLLDSYPELFLYRSADYVGLAPTWMSSSYLDLGYVGVSLASILIGSTLGLSCQLLNMAHENTLKWKLLAILHSVNLAHVATLVYTPMSLMNVIALLISIYLALKLSANLKHS